MDGSCNNTYDKDNKIINSPNYPRVHPEYTDCTWSIAVPIGFQIRVEQFSYSIKLGGLRIYDAARKKEERRIATLEGNDRYNGMISTTNYMFFWFYSYREDKGFQISFSLIGMQMNST